MGGVLGKERGQYERTMERMPAPVCLRSRVISSSNLPLCVYMRMGAGGSADVLLLPFLLAYFLSRLRLNPNHSLKARTYP